MNDKEKAESFRQTANRLAERVVKLEIELEKMTEERDNYKLDDDYRRLMSKD